MKRMKMKGSIRFKLIVLPLILVFIAISVLGVSTSILVRDNLIEAKRDSGFELIHQIKDRVSDNNESIENINKMMEDNMRIASAEIIKNREDLSNEHLQHISEVTGIETIAWFSPEKEVLYSNIAANIGWVPEDGHSLIDFSNSSETEMFEEIRQATWAGSNDFFKFGAIKAPDGSFVQFGINANVINELLDKYSYQNLVEELSKSDSIAFSGFAYPNITAKSLPTKYTSLLIIKVLTEPNSVFSNVLISCIFSLLFLFIFLSH